MKRAVLSAIAALVFLSACAKEPVTHEGKSVSEWIQLTEDSDPQTRADAEAALKALYGRSDLAAQKYRQLYADKLDMLADLIEAWMTLSQEDRSDLVTFCQLFDETARMTCSTPRDLLPIAERMKLAMTIYETDPYERDLFNQVVEPRIQFYNSLGEER